MVKKRRNSLLGLNQHSLVVNQNKLLSLGFQSIVLGLFAQECDLKSLFSSSHFMRISHRNTTSEITSLNERRLLYSMVNKRFSCFTFHS